MRSILRISSSFHQKLGSRAEHPQNLVDIRLIKVNHEGISKGVIHPIHHQVNLHDDFLISPYLIVPKDFIDDSQSPFKVKPQAVSLPDVLENRFLNVKSRGVSLRFFRESSPKLSNRQGCAPKIFRESSPQISRGVPLSFFDRIKSPNLKSQGVSPSQNSNRKGYPLRFFA